MFLQLQILFFIFVLVLGGLILYEDIKKRKIRNNFLILLITAGILLNYLAGTFLGHISLFVINVLVATCVALTIWLAGLWSAADAKLYISLVFLFPVVWFDRPYGYFPGVAILINSTLPLALLLIGQVLVQTNRVQRFQAIKKILRPGFLANLVVVGTGAILLRSAIADFFNLRLDYFLTLPLFLGLFWVVGRFKIKIIYFFIFFAILCLIFTPHLANVRLFLSVLIFSILMAFGVWIISLAQPLFSQQVKISELKEGMILNEMIIKKEQGIVKQPMAFLTLLTSLTQRMKSKPLFGYNPDGLKESEVKEIQKMRGKMQFETIGVAKTLPFAFALLLGVLMTYFFRGSFV